MWFDEARFGVFIHWGHCSQSGWELSWPLTGISDIPLLAPMPDIPPDEYHAGGRTFCPSPGAFSWLADAAAAGARYAVLTAKHHDGYALWPTTHTDWSIARSPYQGGHGDLVREYVDAARAAGLKVGLYFSLPDWHHPDYPPITADDRPYWNTLGRRPPADAWERFRGVITGQLEELLTQYGQIDLLWFDGQWERSAAEWDAAGIAALVRTLQPGIVINDRLPGQGDYETPEQYVPAQPPDHRWETCMTMNRSWGWVPDDQDYKSGTDLIHTLCETAGRGGNLLLNLSPQADGSLPEAIRSRLAAIGGWMAEHHDAIHDTEPGLEPWQFYGPSTRRGDRVFLHLLWKPYERVTVRGVPLAGASARTLTGEPLAVTTRPRGMDGRVGDLIIDVPPDVVDDHATVIEVQLKHD